jgi:hypothetical protein
MDRDPGQSCRARPPALRLHRSPPAGTPAPELRNSPAAASRRGTSRRADAVPHAGRARPHADRDLHQALRPPGVSPGPADGYRATRAPAGAGPRRHRRDPRAAAPSVNRPHRAGARQRAALGPAASAAAQGAGPAAQPGPRAAGGQRRDRDRAGLPRLDRQRAVVAGADAAELDDRGGGQEVRHRLEEHLHCRPQDPRGRPGAAADRRRKHRSEPRVQPSHGYACGPAIRGPAGGESRGVQDDDPGDAATQGAGARVRAEPAHGPAARAARDPMPAERTSSR